MPNGSCESKIVLVCAPFVGRHFLSVHCSLCSRIFLRPRRIENRVADFIGLHARRDAESISQQKKSIIAILGNVAELGAGRMEETIGEASLRDATIGTGVAIDKILALTGQTPAVQIANIVMPSAEERAKIDASHRALDAIARRLAAAQAPRE